MTAKKDINSQHVWAVYCDLLWSFLIAA